MLITRETDYALRILRALSDGEKHTMRDLCQAEEVPQQFAYKITRKLAAVGIIQSIRGADGGCQLTADLQNITLYRLIHVMEQKTHVNACMEPEFHCMSESRRGLPCSIHATLAHIQAVLDNELRSHTLSELLQG